MLTLELSKNRKYLYIGCHPSYARRIHEIPQDVQFSYEAKKWITTPDALPFIEEHFRGEIYYKTPKWFFDGKDGPDKIDPQFYREKADTPPLKIDPYEYQELGAQFMIDRIRKYGFCLNSDGVGAGKTIQSIMVMSHFIGTGEAKNILIICKKSIKRQWKNEIEKFSYDQMPIYIVDGEKKRRDKTYADMRNEGCGIMILNYHAFLNDFSQINAFPWDLVILDEAHSVKSHDTKMNSLIGYTMRGKRCIFLTATPILSSPEDLFGILNMGSLTYFGNFKEFEKRYLVIEYGKFGRQIIGARNLDELNDLTSEIMIRRTPSDINVELPDLIEIPIRNDRDEVQQRVMAFIEKEKANLDTAKEKVLADKDLPKDERIKMIEAINDKSKMFLAAQQFAADDPRILTMMEDGYVSRMLRKQVPKNYTGSAKTEATIDTVESVVSSGEKVIVFCHYSTPAKLLASLIEKQVGIKPLMFTGEEGEEEREQTLQAFIKSSDAAVLIGTDAMAEGLNLQTARYEIHYEQADTDAIRTQRIGRIKRIGSSHESVVVYDIITEGSFDEIKLRKLERDRNTSGAIVG